MENLEYTKKLEEENALLNKKVMEYEDIIKKLDPSFFEIKGVVDENIEEEKEDVYKKNGYRHFEDKIQEYFKKVVESRNNKTASEKLDDEILKAIDWLMLAPHSHLEDQ